MLLCIHMCVCVSVCKLLFMCSGTSTCVCVHMKGNGQTQLFLRLLPPCLKRDLSLGPGTWHQASLDGQSSPEISLYLLHLVFYLVPGMSLRLSCWVSSVPGFPLSPSMPHLTSQSRAGELTSRERLVHRGLKLKHST